MRIIKESPVEVSYALDFRGGKGDQVPPPLTIRTSLNPRAIVVEDLRLRRMMYFLADLGTQSLPLSEDEFLRLCDVEPLPQDAFKKKYGKAKKTTLYRLFQTNVQRPLGRLRITTSSLVKKRPDGYTLTNVRLVHGLSSGPHGEIQYFDETQQYGACPARS